MDDKTKRTMGGGGVGAVVGGALGGPYGAAIGGLTGALIGSRERKHNQAVRETYYTLHEATAGQPRFHVDHIQPSGAEPGGTRGVIADVSRSPDIIMSSPGLTYPSLIIELETRAGIENDENHAIRQLNDFKTQGFKRVLVVPAEELDDIFEWCEFHEARSNIAGEVTLSTPQSIAAVL